MTQSRVLRAVTASIVSMLAGFAVLTAAPASSHAEQFVLFDVMFTYTKVNADTSTPSKSHYYVRTAMLNPMRPRDWTSPIDYRNGTVHVRTEVIDKPAGGAPTRWTLCYIPNRGANGGYGCTNTSPFTEEGIYDADIGMTTWWQNDGIVWTEGIKQMDLVIKDTMGRFGHTLPAEQYFPTTLRITMIQVSKGATYDPSKVPGLPPGVADAGAPSDAGSGSDAGAPADAGGAGGAGGSGSGSGGSDGTGGTAGTAGTGGSTGSGGAPAGGTGGSPPSTGTGGSPGPGPGAVGGGCAVGGRAAPTSVAMLLIALALGLFRRRH